MNTMRVIHIHTCWHTVFEHSATSAATPAAPGGTLWRAGRRLVVGSVYGALHPKARQLAEPGRNRDQSVFAAMSGPAPDRRSGFSAETNSGLESSYESSLCSHPMAIYSQEGVDAPR